MGAERRRKGVRRESSRPKRFGWVSIRMNARRVHLAGHADVHVDSYKPRRGRRTLWSEIVECESRRLFPGGRIR